MGTHKLELHFAQLNVRAWTVLSHTRGPHRDSLSDSVARFVSDVCYLKRRAC
jgi:hypothetical protein